MLSVPALRSTRFAVSRETVVLPVNLQTITPCPSLQDAAGKRGSVVIVHDALQYRSIDRAELHTFVTSD